MIYKSYLFRSSIMNWLGITFILVVLIWFSRAIPFMSFITENGIEISDFFYLFILILPWISIYLLPISFFIAILLSLNKFSQNNEIIILKSCGLSNFKIAQPIIFFGMILTLFVYFLSFYLMPFANKQLRISRHNIEQNYTNISFAPQNFENIDKITIYTKERDDKNNLRGILINDQRHQDFSITLTAEFGNLIAKNDEVFLKLKNGTLQRYNFESRQSEILKFDEYIFNLNNKNHESFNFKWKPNERFINELIYPNENLPIRDLEKIDSELHKRVNDPLISLVFSILICSSILGVKISRKGNFFNSILTLIWCLIYIISLIFSYRLSEKMNSLFFLPYFINFTFLIMAFLPLILNSFLKNDK